MRNVLLMCLLTLSSVAFGQKRNHNLFLEAGYGITNPTKEDFDSYRTCVVGVGYHFSSSWAGRVTYQHARHWTIDDDTFNSVGISAMYNLPSKARLLDLCCYATIGYLWGKGYSLIETKELIKSPYGWYYQPNYETVEEKKGDFVPTIGIDINVKLTSGGNIGIILSPEISYHSAKGFFVDNTLSFNLFGKLRYSF